MSRLCRSRSPDLDPFGIRRSRTTVTGARGRSRGPGTRATAPKKPSSHRRARDRPSPCIDRDSKRPCLWAADVFRFGRQIAGDRPPRYDKKTVLEPSRGKPARMRVWHPRAPALRENRDREGSPTGRNRDREGSPTVLHRDMKHPQIN